MKFQLLPYTIILYDILPHYILSISLNDGDNPYILFGKFRLHTVKKIFQIFTSIAFYKDRACYYTCGNNFYVINQKKNKIYYNPSKMYYISATNDISLNIDHLKWQNLREMHVTGLTLSRILPSRKITRSIFPKLRDIEIIEKRTDVIFTIDFYPEILTINSAIHILPHYFYHPEIKNIHILYIGKQLTDYRKWNQLCNLRSLIIENICPNELFATQKFVKLEILTISNVNHIYGSGWIGCRNLKSITLHNNDDISISNSNFLSQFPKLVCLQLCVKNRIPGLILPGNLTKFLTKNITFRELTAVSRVKKLILDTKFPVSDWCYMHNLCLLRLSDMVEKITVFEERVFPNLEKLHLTNLTISCFNNELSGRLTELICAYVTFRDQIMNIYHFDNLTNLHLGFVSGPGGIWNRMPKLEQLTLHFSVVDVCDEYNMICMFKKHIFDNLKYMELNVGDHININAKFDNQNFANLSAIMFLYAGCNFINNFFSEYEFPSLKNISIYGSDPNGRGWYSKMPLIEDINTTSADIISTIDPELKNKISLIK